MDKVYEQDDDISCLQRKIKELDDKKEEAKIMLEKLEKQKISESKDINNKLSEYAQNTIEGTKGPLTSYQLFKFLMNNGFGKQSKSILANIRKYSNNVRGVQEQLSKVSDNLEAHMEYMKKQKKLDNCFTRNLKKLEKSINDELALEKKSNTIQNPLEHCLNAKKTPLKKERSGDVRNGKNSQKKNLQDQSPSFSELVQATKRNRKRKTMEKAVKEVTKGIRKRLRLTSPESGSQHTEPMSVSDSSSQDTVSMASVDSSSQHTEPMSIVNSEESSSQSNESPVRYSRKNPKKGKSTEKLTAVGSSSQHTEPTSIVNSEGSSSQSIESPVRYSRKNAKKGKSTEKLSLIPSTSQESATGDDELEYNVNIKTVSETHFNFRGKPFR